MTHNVAQEFLPHLITDRSRTAGAAIIARDHAVLSPSYTRCYPLVMKRGEGAMVEDVDGNRFLDFQRRNRGGGHRALPPTCRGSIQKQAAEFLHMSGTDFYYESMVQLAEKLAALVPGDVARRVYFGNSGTEAVEAAIKLARYHTGRDKFIAFLAVFMAAPWARFR